MALCPRTGGSICLCEHKPRSKEGRGMILDLKCALRRVFGEHTLYTSAFIVASLPAEGEDADAWSKRLLENPKHIAKLLSPIIGAQHAADIDALFTEHLLLAAVAVGKVRAGNKKAIGEAVEQLYEQGDHVAEALSALNPEKLPLDKVAEEFHQHNQFVVELATLREQRQYEEYIRVFDTYRAHMDMFSDLLYSAL